MNPTDWRYSDPDTIRNVIRSLFDILEQPMSWMYVSQHRVVIRTLRQPFLVKNRENTSLRGFSAQVCCDYILWQNDDIKSVDIQVLDSADFNDYWNHVRPSGWGITYCHNLEPWVPLNALNPQPLLKQNPNQKFVMYSFCREFCISNEFLFVPFARHCIKEVHQYAELQANKAKRKMCNLSTDEDAKKQIKVS
jgi:hypothetical protein